jgi:hypothetical protein
MKYTQHNPLPIPDIGPTESIDVTMASIFDWEYALKRENLLALYEKGKANTWNATDLDWSVEVNLEKIQRDYMGMGSQEVFNQMMSPPRPLDADEAVDLNLNINAWMLSQFLHGEQGALLATAKIVQGVPWEEAKWYAANQVADEARHVEVYHRYLTEKLGISFGVNRHLRVLLDDIISDSRWDMTYLGMQIMVGGSGSLAAFGMMRLPGRMSRSRTSRPASADESRTSPRRARSSSSTRRSLGARCASARSSTRPPDARPARWRTSTSAWASTKTWSTGRSHAVLSGRQMLLEDRAEFETLGSTPGARSLAKLDLCASST